MKENERVLLWVIIAFILGVIFTAVFASNAVNTNNMGMMRMMGMRSSQMLNIMEEDNHGEKNKSMMMQMDEMTAGLKGKSGDAFDEAFLSEMISHHQGAIEMAELAKENAAHQEIKDLAADIINAQTNEIEMMKNWQQEWGY